MSDVSKNIDNKRIIEARSFSIFRLLFGLMMIPQIQSIVPSIHGLADSTFVFHYPYLSFIEAYSHELIDQLAAIGSLGALLLAFGIFPRIGALLFLVTFGYLFLIDMNFYNNHYYLWCLIAFLFVCSDVQQSISIIDVIKKQTNKTIDVSNYWIFAILISIVYCYGGLVKINGDWLQGYPMRMMAAARKYPAPDIVGLFMSYAGLLFDLFIWVLLWKKPKALYTIIPYLVFHGSNYFVFNIGEFPLVMLAAWFIFLPLPQANPFKGYINFGGVRKYALYTFFAFQLIFPLRSLLVGGNVAWHQQGYYFSWRMMLNNHELVDFQFFVEIPDKNDKYAVDFRKLLSFRQFAGTYHSPLSIWQLAQKLKNDAKTKYNSTNVHVFCRSIITLNQHTPKALIDESMDLTQSEFKLFSKNDFITNF